MSSPEDNPRAKGELALLSWIHRFAPYGVFTLDTSLRVQSWNQWMESHSLLAGTEVIGRAIFEIYPDLEERRLTSTFQRALDGEYSVLSTALHQYLVPLKSPLSPSKGNWMRQTARVAPLLSEGIVCGVVVVIEDVTQRENQADILIRQHRRDEVLSWALVHLLKSDEPRKTARQLFFKIAEHLDFDTFFLYLREVESGEIQLYTAGGISEDLQRQFLRYGPFLNVGNADEAIIFDLIKNRTEPEYDLLKEAKISSAIAIPLRGIDKSLGLLCFASWNRERIALEEIDLLTTIAQYLATAVDKERTIHELQLAQKNAESASRAKDDFLAALSHELRTPLNPVLLLASDSAVDPGLSPQIRANFETIRKNIELEARLIDDLLDLTRITRGKLVLNQSELDVHEILKDAIANVLNEIEHKRIVLKLDLCPDGHKIFGDAVRLQQVFWNVLKNSAKFTPEGGHISIESRTLPVDKFLINITDTGIGMDADETEYIFGAFSQGPHQFGGLGLGLAISRVVVGLHSGSIRASSPGKGRGATFSIELPIITSPGKKQ